MCTNRHLAAVLAPAQGEFPQYPSFERAAASAPTVPVIPASLACASRYAAGMVTGIETISMRQDSESRQQGDSNTPVAMPKPSIPAGRSVAPTTSRSQHTLLPRDGPFLAQARARRRSAGRNDVGAAPHVLTA